MKKRIKKLWVAALRSGKYKQAKNQLRDETNAFCCYGVLCNIHAQEHPKIAAAQKDDEKYMGAYAHLPYAVAYWAGFKPGFTNRIRIAGTVDFLSAHNDNGASFTQIANAIEEQL